MVSFINKQLRSFSQFFLCFFFAVLQVSVVNQLDMQVVVSNIPPTYVEKNKNKLLR